MTTRLVIDVNTSNTENITISLSSISKDGLTGNEKMLASKIIETMGRAKGFPKITALDSGDGN